MQKLKFENTVSETLLINLYFRARENELSRPILRDEFSGEVVRRIAQESDYDFAKFDAGKFSRIGAVVRARFFDDWILNLAQNRTDVIIVQVGAGLDTRPLRLQKQLPDATFYDLDLPDVIALRERFVPKAARNFSIACSMLETEWMDKLAKKHPQGFFIFVLEGISMYFDAEIFSKFVANLAAKFKGALIADFLNKFSARQDAKKHDVLRLIKPTPKFRLGIDNPGEVKAWSNSIKHLKTGVMMDMWRERWPFLARLLRFIPAVRNSCNMYVFGLNLD